MIFLKMQRRNIILTILKNVLVWDDADDYVKI